MERVFFLHPDLRIRMRAWVGLLCITLMVVARCALCIVLLKEFGRFIDLIHDKHAFDAALAAATWWLCYGGALGALQVLANIKLFYAWWWREVLMQEYFALQLRIERARTSQPMNPLEKMQSADADASLKSFGQTVQEGTASATRLYLDMYDPMVYAFLSVVGNLFALAGQDAAFKFSWDVPFGGCLVWGIVLVCAIDVLLTHLLGRKIPGIKRAVLERETKFRALLDGGPAKAPTLDAYELRSGNALKDLSTANARVRWHQVLVSVWQGPYQVLFEYAPWIVLGLCAYCSDVATVGMISQSVGTLIIIKNGVCTFTANWSTSISDLFANRQRLNDLFATLRRIVEKVERVEVQEASNIVPFPKRA